MLKVKRGKGMRRCFVEVSESRHSPLVLARAHTQGCSSPLIHARTKYLYRLILPHFGTVNIPHNHLNHHLGLSQSPLRDHQASQHHQTV